MNEQIIKKWYKHQGSLGGFLSKLISDGYIIQQVIIDRMDGNEFHTEAQTAIIIVIKD